MEVKNPFKVLGLPTTATDKEIAVAYRKLAKENHPDHGGDVTRMGEINKARDDLADPRKRAYYAHEQQSQQPLPEGRPTHFSPAGIYVDFAALHRQIDALMQQAANGINDPRMKVAITITRIQNIGGKRTVHTETIRK